CGSAGSTATTRTRSRTKLRSWRFSQASGASSPWCGRKICRRCRTRLAVRFTSWRAPSRTFWSATGSARSVRGRYSPSWTPPDSTCRRPSIAPSGPCPPRDRKSTRLNSSHDQISYAVFCLKKKKKKKKQNKTDNQRDHKHHQHDTQNERPHPHVPNVKTLVQSEQKYSAVSEDANTHYADSR